MWCEPPLRCYGAVGFLSTSRLLHVVWMLGRHGDRVGVCVGGARRLRLESFSIGQAWAVSGLWVLRKEEDKGWWWRGSSGRWGLASQSRSHPLTPTTTINSPPCNDLCGRVTQSWLPEPRDRRRATARRTDHFPIDPALPGPSLPFNIL